MARVKKQTREDLLAKKRAAEKARRDRIKLNPEAHEKYKEKERERNRKRKDENKLVSINDMTPRQKRNQRRKWKINSKNFRDKQKRNVELQKKLAESTPPDSDSEASILVQDRPASPTPQHGRPLTRSKGGEEIAGIDMAGTSRQCDSPKSDVSSVQRRLRYNADKKLMLQKAKIIMLKKQNEMLRKRLTRSNNRLKKQKFKSPKSKAEHLLSDPYKKEDVKKNLIFAEVMKNNLTTNYENLKSNKEKQTFKENIDPAFKTLKKYKMLTGVKHKIARKVKARKNKSITKENIKEGIKLFFERDDNSRMAAGKKECITRNKEKKQKRYLQDSLNNLHKKFLVTHQYVVSYSFFCNCKPFWIVFPTDKDKDTCMCKLHENVTLLAQALWKNKIIQEKSSSEILAASVCNTYNINCLERACTQCRNKMPYIMEFNNSMELNYWKWESTSKEVTTKTGTKLIKITEKKRHTDSPKTVIDLLLNLLQKFYTHCNN